VTGKPASCAVISGDPSAIDPMWSPDFYGFNPTSGSRYTRKDFRDSLLSKQPTVEVMNFPRFFVRMFGNTAVAKERTMQPFRRL